MEVAKIYPEPEKLKRGGSSVSEQQGLSKARLSEARTVLQYAPDLADNVLSGSSSLDDAYKTARKTSLETKQVGIPRGARARAATARTFPRW